jgi:hypothetical protein
MANNEFDDEDLKELFRSLSANNVNGTYEDTIPNGVGEFGLEPTNPIPVMSIPDSRDYLERLRADSGEIIEYERIGSIMNEDLDGPVDAYRIFSMEGEVLATIYISAYHNKNSEKAPKGFFLHAE